MSASANASSPENQTAASPREAAVAYLARMMSREDPENSRFVNEHEPQVSLLGEIDESSVSSLRDQLRKAEEADGPVTVEVATLGGDAEAGRRIVLELDLARQRLANRKLLFLGKTTVYSAGVTIMSAFPRCDRFLSADTMLLIHCRQLEKTLELSGPMRGSRAKVEALLHQIDTGVGLEIDNFRRLIEGSDITMEEITDRALYNWYVPADEALERGLIAGII